MSSFRDTNENYNPHTVKKPQRTTISPLCKVTSALQITWLFLFILSLLWQRDIFPSNPVQYLQNITTLHNMWSVFKYQHSFSHPNTHTMKWSIRVIQLYVLVLVVNSWLHNTSTNAYTYIFYCTLFVVIFFSNNHSNV